MPAIPPEILLLILDELPKSSLLSFGRTSKWAWAIAEPLLYHNITFQFLRYEYINYHRGAPALPAEHPVHSFFRAIRRRPARASYVKAATFLTNSDSYPHGPHPAFSRFFKCPAPPDVEPLWLEASATLDHGCTSRKISIFRDQVDVGHPTVLVAILLTCLPELETLVADFTLQNYANIGHLLMLKEVTIRNDLNWGIGHGRYRTQEVLSLVCLPRLEHLSAVFGGIDGDEITHANLPALRTLKLTDKIPIQVLVGRYPHRVKLREILPPGLEKLYLRDDYPPETRERDFSIEGLIEDLRSYLLDPEPANKALALQEVRLKLRYRSLRINFGQVVLREGRELGKQHPLRRLENIARKAGVKCTIHYRISNKSIISAERECMDEVDEAVLYDPSTVCPGDGMIETTMEPTRYLTRRRLKKARCFYSEYG